MIHYLRVATILNLNTWTEQGESWMREGDRHHSTNYKVLFSWVNVSDFWFEALLHPIVRLNWSPRGNTCLSLSGVSSANGSSVWRVIDQSELAKMWSPRGDLGLRVDCAAVSHWETEQWVVSGLHPAWLPSLLLATEILIKLLIGQAKLRSITHYF